jgi:hypothetical protein
MGETSRHDGVAYEAYTALRRRRLEPAEGVIIVPTI